MNQKPAPLTIERHLGSALGIAALAVDLSRREASFPDSPRLIMLPTHGGARPKARPKMTRGSGMTNCAGVTAQFGSDGSEGACAHHGAMRIVSGPPAPICMYTNELEATGINCRVAAGSDMELDMFGDGEYCIGVGLLQSKTYGMLAWPGARVERFPTITTPPPQASLYQYGVEDWRPGT